MQDQQSEDTETSKNTSENSWKFHDEAADATLQANENTKIQPSQQSIDWTASEFISHDKTHGWYLLMGIGSILLAGAVYVFNRDIFATVIVLFTAIIFGVLAARKPRVLSYAVGTDGVMVDSKLHSYSEFRSFAIIQEGGIESIWLMPLKRFAPIMSVYFEPQDGKQIVGMLSRFLPIENHKLDPIDKFMHKVRF
jgi:hypothetical protein